MNVVVFRPQGFTLLEILLVVLIVAIMAGVGANLISNQSAERAIMSEAEQINANITYLCEKSVLENQAYGLEWTETGYHVLQFQRQEWLLSEAMTAEPNPADLTYELRIDGLPQTFKAEPEQLPHLVCQPDGSINAFELRIADPQTTADPRPYYALSSATPWQIQGRWYHQ